MRFLPLLFLLFFFTGCTRVVREPVYIPTKCDIIPQTRPHPTHSSAQDVQNILIYTEKLERDLDFCIRGEI